MDHTWRNLSCFIFCFCLFGYTLGQNFPLIQWWLLTCWLNPKNSLCYLPGLKASFLT